MHRLADLASLLGATASLVTALNERRSVPAMAGRHRRAWARLRLRAARVEHGGDAAKAAALRAIAEEHLSIASRLEGGG